MQEKGDKTKGHHGNQRKDENKMIRRRGEHLHRLLVMPGLEMENGFLQTQLLHQVPGMSQADPPDGLEILRTRHFANNCVMQVFGAGGRNSANLARPGDRSGECLQR